jgi:hypothetical protein
MAAAAGRGMTTFITHVVLMVEKDVREAKHLLSVIYPGALCML